MAEAEIRLASANGESVAPALAMAGQPTAQRAVPTSTGGFWSLFVTQFQGAFSDYILKTLVVFMMLGMNVTLAEQNRIGEWVTALYSLPFILFSMAGGYLADRYSKRSVMIGVKVFEIGVMVSMLAGFILNNWHILMAGVFLMGVHSAFFGPSKYGSLPEQLPAKRLSWGNGLIELGTFVAIIFGTWMAGKLSECFHDRQIVSGVILIALAAFGLACSLGVHRVPAADPNRSFEPNFLKDLWNRTTLIRQDRALKLSVIGNIYFSFIATLLLLDLFFYGAHVLKVSDERNSLLSCALALGVGFGSAAAGFLSGNKIETGLIPFGAAGLSVACVGLFFADSYCFALVWLALLGFAGGFFVVPISALL
ncbi:MAG TPA: MFS transporter, partial [Verrucomicrobiae bacterium]|nr:MFS transporter [Verrucomicrobiae bacterium]